MRLLVRFALVIVVCVLLIAAYGYSKICQRFASRNDPKTDETVRILLMSDETASNWEANLDVTFNVVVVLVVSLLSIALLVTGIIVVAITLDPSITGGETDGLDEMSDFQRDQTIWTPRFPSPTSRLLPQMGVIANLNKYSISSISEI